MILPGSTVKVIDENSIYRGYVGCVQRIQGKKAAVLMDSHTPVSYTHLTLPTTLVV